MMSDYSHLYKTSSYVPPSVIRAIEAATPSQGETIGDWRTNTKTLDSMTGQARHDNLVNKKLRNREFYKLMKDKAIYTIGTSITAHAAMNSL